MQSRPAQCWLSETRGKWIKQRSPQRLASLHQLVFGTAILCQWCTITPSFSLLENISWENKCKEEQEKKTERKKRRRLSLRRLTRPTSPSRRVACLCTSSRRPCSGTLCTASVLRKNKRDAYSKHNGSNKKTNGKITKVEIVCRKHFDPLVEGEEEPTVNIVDYMIEC